MTTRSTERVATMDRTELIGREAPFKVRLIGRKKLLTVVGFSERDPLDEGSHGIVPPMATAHFEGGGWLLVSDLLKHYEIAEAKP